ncbi:MAG: trimeric intracellular cation channel family protein [Clostridiaceae bacterium]
MEFISVVEIIGTIAFAVSGALTAIEKKLDYYGIIVFAIITSVGGGIVRDILIDRSLPSALKNPIYMVISILTAIIVIQYYSSIIRLEKVLQLFDAIGLGAFTAIGAEVAVGNGLYQPFVIITLAVLTGTGGGVIRDVFAKRVPFVFREEIYAVAATIGALLFVVIYKFAGNQEAVYSCFAVTLAIRLFCMKLNVQLNKVDKLYKLHKAA